MSTVRLVDVNTLEADLKAGLPSALIDVRGPDEYADGHVPEAKLLPLPELQARWEELLPYKDQGELYLICRSGARSMSAAQALLSVGFRTVNVTGGTMAWVGAGKPVAR